MERQREKMTKGETETVAKRGTVTKGHTHTQTVTKGQRERDSDRQRF